MAQKPYNEMTDEEMLTHNMREFRLTLIGLQGMKDRAVRRLWELSNRRGLIFWRKRDAMWCEKLGNELATDLEATVRNAVFLAVKLAQAGYSYGLIDQEVASDKQYVQYGWYDAEGNVPFTGQATALSKSKRSLAFVDNETPTS
jgi:lactate dehydrogenase-like 2-hydroxyacid dehydrogenase